MQTLAQLGIVHIGIPAEARETFHIARHNGELVIVHLRKVALALFSICPFGCSHCIGMRSPDIHNVAIEGSADFHAIGIDKNEARNVAGVLARHFSGNPSAERTADDCDIFQRELIHDVEHHIGKIVNIAHPIGAI